MPGCDETAHTRIHRFAARDEDAALALVGALVAFGFAEVGARPATRPGPRDGGMLWEVIAVDLGPYPRGMLGVRQSDAVERQARAIARAHGSFWCGGMTGGGGRLPSLQRSAPPVLQLNPGARPAVPPVPVIPAPPLGDMALAPDRAPIRPARLEGLAAIPGIASPTPTGPPATSPPGSPRWPVRAANGPSRSAIWPTCCCTREASTRRPALRSQCSPG